MRATRTVKVADWEVKGFCDTALHEFDASFVGIGLLWRPSSYLSCDTGREQGYGLACPRGPKLERDFKVCRQVYGSDVLVMASMNSIDMRERVLHLASFTMSAFEVLGTPPRCQYTTPLDPL